MKTKEHLTNIIKKQDNSIKRIISSNKKGKSFHTPNLSPTSSAKKILKEFNGKIENYLITKELGKGSYATVKLAVNKINKKKICYQNLSKRIINRATKKKYN